MSDIIYFSLILFSMSSFMTIYFDNVCCSSVGLRLHSMFIFVFFNETATTDFYTYGHTLSLHDALPTEARSSGDDGVGSQHHAERAEQRRTDLDGPRRRQPQHLAVAQVQEDRRVPGVGRQQRLQLADELIRKRGGGHLEPQRERLPRHRLEGLDGHGDQLRRGVAGGAPALNDRYTVVSEVVAVLGYGTRETHAHCSEGGWDGKERGKH